MPVRALDYSALTDPVARSEVVAFRDQARASGAPWAQRTVTPAAIVLVLVIGVVFVFFFGGALQTLVTLGIRNGNTIGVAFPLLIVAVAVLLVVSGVRRWRQRGHGWERLLRTFRFAQANGMTFTPGDVAPDYPGEIFGIGTEQKVDAHLEATADGRFLDMGNYRYVTGSGRSRTVHNWGFLALALDRAMPNIVLDSKANNTLFGSNLPATLDKSQVLHLEGDFDRYFTLYCPAQYETDALYIFTPDLMALLIDEAAPFDVELVDRWMFVYSSTTFDLADPATLQRLFTIADTVGTKALSQTEHYADDRIGDAAVDIVAPQGARLRRGVSVAGIVIVVAFAAFWGWSVFHGFFGG